MSHPSGLRPPENAPRKFRHDAFVVLPALLREMHAQDSPEASPKRVFRHTCTEIEFSSERLPVGLCPIPKRHEMSADNFAQVFRKSLVLLRFPRQLHPAHIRHERPVDGEAIVGSVAGRSCNPEGRDVTRQRRETVAIQAQQDSEPILTDLGIGEQR